MPQAFGALKLTGRLYLYLTSYYNVHMKSLLLPILPCIQFHQQFLHALSLDHLTRSYLYNSHYVQSVLNSVIRASCITIKSSGVRKSHDEHQHQKTSHCDNCQLMPAFHVLDHAIHQFRQLLVDLKACTLPTCCPSLC